MTAGTVQHVLPHQELLIALHVELTLQPSQQLLLHLNLPFNGLSGSKRLQPELCSATTSIFPSSLARSAAIPRNKHRSRAACPGCNSQPSAASLMLGKGIWREHLSQWAKPSGTVKRENRILVWVPKTENISVRATEKAEAAMRF